METLTNKENAYATVAALFLHATHPHADPNEAGNAFRVLRSRMSSGGIDPHLVADRIRGCESFKQDSEAPAFLAMTIATRRSWLDAVALRMRLTTWERRFIANIRGLALSSTGRLSTAQTRAVQGLIDKAWNAGVRA